MGIFKKFVENVKYNLNYYDKDDELSEYEIFKNNFPKNCLSCKYRQKSNVNKYGVICRLHYQRRVDSNYICDFYDVNKAYVKDAYKHKCSREHQKNIWKESNYRKAEAENK